MESIHLFKTCLVYSTFVFIRVSCSLPDHYPWPLFAWKLSHLRLSRGFTLWEDNENTQNSPLFEHQIALLSLNPKIVTSQTITSITNPRSLTQSLEQPQEIAFYSVKPSVCTAMSVTSSPPSTLHISILKTQITFSLTNSRTMLGSWRIRLNWLLWLLQPH